MDLYSILAIIQRLVTPISIRKEKVVCLFICLLENKIGSTSHPLKSIGVGSEMF